MQVHIHRLVSTFFENFYFIKKSDPTFHPLYFFIIRYSKTTCKKHHMHVNIQNMKNTQKCNKNNFQYFFLSLKYKCTIMCNYLNNYNNLNGCSLRLVYIFMKNVQKKNVFLICLVFFQNFSNKNPQHTHILIPLANWTIYASILK